MMQAHDLGASCALRATYPQHHDDLSMDRDLFLDELVGRLNLQAVCAPAKLCVWCGIAPSKQVDPEAVLQFWHYLVSGDRDMLLASRLGDACQRPVDALHNHGRLDLRIRSDDVDRLLKCGSG